MKSCFNLEYMRAKGIDPSGPLDLRITSGDTILCDLTKATIENNQICGTNNNSNSLLLWVHIKIDTLKCVTPFIVKVRYVLPEDKDLVVEMTMTDEIFIKQDMTPLEHISNEKIDKLIQHLEDVYLQNKVLIKLLTDKVSKERKG